MARGTEAKARRKEQRKEARSSTDTDNNNTPPEDELPSFGDAIKPVDDSSSDEEEDEMPKFTLKKTKIKKKKKTAQQQQQKSPCCPPPSSLKGIKTGPLIVLVMLFGTAIIPAMLFFGDWAGGMIQKHHIMGGLGFKLGIGPSPRQRVVSFYEKHDPTKINDVTKILSKHYGDYPKLIKRLERKYQDYGYFMNWEEDEAPYKLAKEKLGMTADLIGKKWKRHAPLPLQNGARNMKHNTGRLYRKGRVFWKKHAWPHLEPFFGVPKGAAEQKRKDRKAAADEKNKKTKGGRKKNLEFRDDEM